MCSHRESPISNLSGDLLTVWLGRYSDFCSVLQIFFLGSARAYLMASKLRRPFSSPKYLGFGKSSFQNQVKWYQLNSSKNELSLERMLGYILGLITETGIISSQSSLLCVCLRYKPFGKKIKFFWNAVLLGMMWARKCLLILNFCAFLRIFHFWSLYHYHWLM